MQQIRAKADRQVTSLLDFTFWSDLIVILAIVGINIVNILRANSGQSALVTAAEPELVLIVSFALVLYLGYGCVQALSIKSRMNRVFVSLDEARVARAEGHTRSLGIVLIAEQPAHVRKRLHRLFRRDDGFAFVGSPHLRPCFVRRRSAVVDALDDVRKRQSALDLPPAPGKRQQHGRFRVRSQVPHE